MVELIQGDCLEKMKDIESNSIDMILTDPPYGTTACSWDTVINLDLMWLQLKRIVKSNSAIVMTASQPFTTILISSNIKMFKYEWIWEKSKSTGHALVKIRPLKSHENILVFCLNVEFYNPIRTKGVPYRGTSRNPKSEDIAFTIGPKRYDNKGNRYPKTNLKFKNAQFSDGTFHPTQKPVTLMEYLINTYTNKNQTVLDFTMGSGTTGVAAVNLDRNFIGIELDEKYFEIAKDRINKAIELKRPKCSNCSNSGWTDDFKMTCTYESVCYIIPNEIKTIGCSFHIPKPKRIEDI